MPAGHAKALAHLQLVERQNNAWRSWRGGDRCTLPWAWRRPATVPSRMAASDHPLAQRRQTRRSRPLAWRRPFSPHMAATGAHSPWHGGDRPPPPHMAAGSVAMQRGWSSVAGMLAEVSVGGVLGCLTRAGGLQGVSRTAQGIPTASRNAANAARLCRPARPEIQSCGCGPKAFQRRPGTSEGVPRRPEGPRGLANACRGFFRGLPQGFHGPPETILRDHTSGPAVRRYVDGSAAYGLCARLGLGRRLRLAGS